MVLLTVIPLRQCISDDEKLQLKRDLSGPGESDAAEKYKNRRPAAGLVRAAVDAVTERFPSPSVLLKAGHVVTHISFLLL